MAIRYKNNGKYAYETRSVWNKEKKKHETKWKYLGVVDENGKIKKKTVAKDKSETSVSQPIKLTPAFNSLNYIKFDNIDEYTYFTLRHELEISRLVGISHVTSAKGLDFFGEDQFHTCWVLIFVNRGALRLETATNVYILKEGEMIICRPIEHYKFKEYENNKVNIYHIAFICENPAMQSLERWIISLSSREREYIDNVVSFHHKFLLKKLAEAVVHIPIHAQFGIVHSLRSDLEQLMISVITRDKKESMLERAESFAKKETARRLIKQVSAYMKKNISQTLTLTQIAKDLGYSVPHIKATFQKEKGQGVIDYFIEMKINSAKFMLREGSLNIKEISEKLGFYSQTYFTRVFKRREGITPSEYGR